MRIGYLLDEDQTEKMMIVADRLGMSPDSAIGHCLDVMWEWCENER